MKFESDIGIVGNGAIAKAAALGLAQRGASVTLLYPSTPSPASDAAWDTRVYALNQVARDLLTSLRVWDAMDQSRIETVDSMVIHGDSEQAGKLSFDAYGAHKSELAWIVEDRNLDQALDAALRFATNVHRCKGRSNVLRLNEDLVSVETDAGDILSAALLIGADGRQSWVRGQCDIDVTFRDYHQQAIVCNFDIELPHHGVAHQWFMAGAGIVALLPLPGNRVSLVWSAPDTLAALLCGESISQLGERLMALPGQPYGKITPLQPEARQALPLVFMRAHSVIAPRVALIGDAAHAIHPLAGHGMNLGFADIADLMRILSQKEPHQNYGDERLLARYARARKEQTLLMQVATDGLERMFATDFEPVRLLRNAGLNLIDKIPFLKRALIKHATGSSGPLS